MIAERNEANCTTSIVLLLPEGAHTGTSKPLELIANRQSRCNPEKWPVTVSLILPGGEVDYLHLDYP
jgi:hypothetical protein